MINDKTDDSGSDLGKMSPNAGGSLHVAIVGAGIGGLALAIALHKKGVPFTVYEEAKQYSVVGAGIGFGPNGLQAMDLIESEFRPRYEKICVGNKPADAQHVFFEGLLLEEGLGLKKDWHGHSSWGHPEYTRRSAHRKELLDVMTEFIPIEKVKFDKRLTSIEETPDCMTLTFADGEVVKSSVVVGTDGIKSTVREHVLRPVFPGEVDAVYANSYCYRGVIPMVEATEILGDLTDVAKMYMGDKRCCVTYRITGGAEFNFLLCASDPKPWPLKEAVTQEVSFEEMISDFDGPGVDRRFIQLLSKAKPIKWGFFHHRYTSTYYRGRAVLLGDSAHASLPFQAAGASQALEDAMILGNLLAKITSNPDSDINLAPYIHAAFDAYDAVRRPRATKQLIQSAEVSDMIHFQDPGAGSDIKKILPRLQKGRFEWLWFHDLNEDLRAAADKMDEVITQQYHT